MAALAMAAAAVRTERAADAAPAPGVPLVWPLQKRPDIVLITIDALRADHLSTYGYRRFTSATIDRLAERSVVFTNAISQAPYTKASIASVMTGLYPTAHKTVTTTVPFVETMTGRLTTTPPTTDVLPASLTTLAESLRAAGYRTIGLTANPFLIAPFGFAQGFDEFEFFPGGDFADGRRMVDAALEAVARSDANPVFVWLHLMEPHSPYAPPDWTRGMFPMEGRPVPVPSGMPIPPWLIAGSPRDLRLYEERYDEEIAAGDIAVDVFLRGFSQLRESEKSVVAITSDHGEQFLDHGGWEHSDTLYDELIHVPLVLQATDVPPAVIHQQVQLVDLYPTLLNFAEAEVPPGIAGRLLPLSRESAEPRPPAFSEIAGAQYAVRTDEWKLIVWADGRQELFDLRDDPHERHNAAADQPAKVGPLRRLADHYLAEALRRGSSIGPERAPIDPRVLERLRALGYFER